MEDQNSLNQELSEYLAKNIYQVRNAVALHGFEDLLLLTQWHRESNLPYFQKGGILRLSKKGVFVYGVSDNERRSISMASYTYTQTPFFSGNAEFQTDKDGVRLVLANPAKSYYDGRDYSAKVLEDGTITKKSNPKSLLTDFISEFAPSALQISWRTEYNPNGGGFPGIDYWFKLDESKKREVIDILINRVERAFLLKTPEINYRLRFNPRA